MNISCILGGQLAGSQPEQINMAGYYCVSVCVLLSMDCSDERWRLEPQVADTAEKFI